MEPVLQTGLVSRPAVVDELSRTAALFHRDTALDVGGLRRGLTGAEVYDLALRVTERSRPGHHVPDVLVTSIARTPVPASPGTSQTGKNQNARRSKMH